MSDCERCRRLEESLREMRDAAAAMMRVIGMSGMFVIDNMETELKASGVRYAFDKRAGDLLAETSSAATTEDVS